MNMIVGNCARVHIVLDLRSLYGEFLKVDFSYMVRRHDFLNSLTSPDLAS